MLTKEISQDTNNNLEELPQISGLKHKIKGTERLTKILIHHKLNKDFANFIIRNSNGFSNHIFFIDNNVGNNINEIGENRYESIINLVKLNKTEGFNNFLANINTKLIDKGILFGFFDTAQSNAKSINLSKSALKFLGNLTLAVYLIVTTFYNRLINRYNYMSRAETYGRLSCFGFEISDEQEFENKYFFAAIKKRTPLFIKKRQHGILIKLPRIGKNMKITHFYKIRTMYPYSEYLQEYLYKANGLQKGGKINNDFRISKFGKFLRKYWIDEIPMLINLLKGEIKLFGVRPLSKHYFDLYSEELQKMRIKTKPGLIPPFFVDFPKTLDEIMESEIKYLKEFEKKPVLTDIKYLLKALINIFFCGYRSK